MEPLAPLAPPFSDGALPPRESTEVGSMAALKDFPGGSKGKRNNKTANVLGKCWWRHVDIYPCVCVTMGWGGVGVGWGM